MNKFELDRMVAFDMDMEIQEVARVTSLFLELAVKDIAKGHQLNLRCFGKFKLAIQGGAPPPHQRYGGGNNSEDGQQRRFRVHFRKSVTLAKAIRAQQEKKHGKVCR
jgi:hypothetical protein